MKAFLAGFFGMALILGTALGIVGGMYFGVTRGYGVQTFVFIVFLVCLFSGWMNYMEKKEKEKGNE